MTTIFNEGHRIGIILSQSDWGEFHYLIRPEPGTKLTVIPSLSEITLPIVGDGDGLSVTASSMEALVERFEEEGTIADHDAAHSLQIHLISVDRFEKQGAAEKVVKHMESFKLLLDHQKENELISEEAHNALKAHTDYLIKKWQ